MKAFEEKLEELSNKFSAALKQFDDRTTPHMLGITAERNCRAEEFKAASKNIKVAC